MKLGKGGQRTRWLAGALVGAGLFLAPFVAGSGYRVHVLNMIGIYCILALGLNLSMGFCGQFNLAMGAFYGVGAYTSTLLSLRLHFPFLLAFLSAAIVCAAVAAAVGLPSLKVQSHYLAIITIGLGQLINMVLVNWEALTGGPIGITGVPAASLPGFVFDSEGRYYWLILACTAVLHLLAIGLVRSRVGLRFRAIRDDIVAARASGVDTAKYQILAFAMSGLCAGVAGSLYAHLTSYVSPDGFTFTQTLFVLTACMVGGMGTLWGPPVGVGVLVAAQEYLRAIGEFQWIVYGATIMILVIALPGGVWSLGPKAEPVRQQCARWLAARTGLSRGGVQGVIANGRADEAIRRGGGSL